MSCGARTVDADDECRDGQLSQHVVHSGNYCKKKCSLKGIRSLRRQEPVKERTGDGGSKSRSDRVLSLVEESGRLKVNRASYQRRAIARYISKKHTRDLHVRIAQKYAYSAQEACLLGKPSCPLIDLRIHPVYCIPQAEVMVGERKSDKALDLQMQF